MEEKTVLGKVGSKFGINGRFHYLSKKPAR